MCGLAGCWVIGGNSGDRLCLIAKGMASVIRHRGPDDSGTWSDETAGLALGFRRLSIIDLSPAGHQPMHSACDRYVMTFNGEIYNHLALRSELEVLGRAPPWRGHSDTETLLAAFAVWGVAPTLRRAVGMFALALWDKQERRLTLVRDRMGEKPLYYGWVGQGVDSAFVFGSELKALRAYPGFSNPVSRDALALYLQYCAVPAPYSIYQGIFKVKPGCILSLDASNLASRTVQTEAYWNLADVARAGLSNPIESESEAVDRLHSTLSEAVKLQAIADVPLGCFLSAGVDSSTIVALMQAQSRWPVKTFTIGFDVPSFDESPYAMAVARHLGTEHHELYVTADDAKDAIPYLHELYDEPFADSSQIPTYLVCKLTRQHVTVALSGDAGDELFGGYNRYFWAPRLWRSVNWLPLALRQGLGRGLGQVPANVWDGLGRTFGINNLVNQLGDKAHKLADRLLTANGVDGLYRSLVTEWPDSNEIVWGSQRLPTLLDDTDLTESISSLEQRMMLWDSLTYLPDDILAKVDRAAMGVSLETRVPFLDHRVIELAWQIPLHMKIRHGQGKWVLRQLLYKYVPRELIERPKAGFTIPIGEWLRGPLRDWAENLLDESRLTREGYFNAIPIRAVWHEHLTGQRDWTSRLWTILMFQAWLEAMQVSSGKIAMAVEG